MKYFLQKDGDNDTPLHCASHSGKHEVVSLLVEKGALLNEINTKGFTPLIYAVMGRHAKTCQILAKKGAKVNSFDKTVAPILIATQNGDLPVCRILVKYKADLNVVSFIAIVLLPFLFIQYRRISALLWQEKLTES